MLPDGFPFHQCYCTVLTEKNGQTIVYFDLIYQYWLYEIVTHSKKPGSYEILFIRMLKKSVRNDG